MNTYTPNTASVAIEDRFLLWPDTVKDNLYYHVTTNDDGTFQWVWVETEEGPRTDAVRHASKADALEAAAADATTYNAVQPARDSLVKKLRAAAQAERDAHTPVDVEAAVIAYLAWRRVAEATTPLEFGSAMVDANNAMGDLASWLPGYEIDTGTIPEEREEW